MNKYEAYQKARAEYLKALDSIEESDIVEKYREFIDKNNLYGVMWYQYTPSFNDGDPCTFTSSRPQAFTKKELVDFLQDQEDSKVLLKLLESGTEEELFENFTPNSLEEYCNYSSSIPVIDDDLLQSLFGDGVTVVITKTMAHKTRYYD